MRKLGSFISPTGKRVIVLGATAPESSPASPSDQAAAQPSRQSARHTWQANRRDHRQGGSQAIRRVGQRGR